MNLVMNVFSALKKKKVERSFFLALMLKPYKVGAILFEKTDNTLAILATKERDLPNSIEELSFEDLVAASDEVISFVEGSLPSAEQVEQTIFAIPREWQSDGKIKKEYQPRFKKLCDDLSLTPMGFLVSIEAIVHALQKKEGVPISSIFIEIARQQIFVYLVRNGNVLQVVSGTSEEDHVVTAVEKLLVSIDMVDVLPPKIVLLDYEGAEGVQQEFLSHNWKKDLPFLHIPQVVVLEKGFENEAVINGVATQMESHITQSLKAPIEETQDVQAESTAELADATEFGFVPEHDVKDGKLHNDEEGAEEDEIGPEHDNIKMVEHAHEPPETSSQDEEKESEYKDTLFTRLQGLNPMTKIKGMKLTPKKLSRLPGKIIKTMPIKGWGVMAGVLVIAAGLIYVYYAYLLKAEVVIFADKRIFDKVETLVLSAQDSTSASDKTLQVSMIEVPVSGEAQIETTGKKETGEKAKGEVTIYNKTEKPRKFEKGTTVTANSLNFVLTEEVNVASTSSFSTSFSSTKAKIEAAKFGKEYNLPSGTNFVIDDQSTSNFFAKNDSAFSGGTKKEIRVVAAKDRTDLEAQIVKQLTQKAKDEAKNKISADQVLLPQQLSYEFDSKSFSKKDGEEANSLSLDASINFKMAAYANNDVNKIVAEYALAEVPSSYNLDQDESDITVTDIKIDEDEKAEGKLQVHAIYTPKIDENAFKKNVSGKMASEAEKAAKSITGVNDVTIKVNKLPILPAIMPFSDKNIIVVIRSDG